ncbi:MAG: hypothetical protein QXF61_04405 [Nitrososphaeria archaeon]
MNKYRIIKVVMSEGEYKFLQEFVSSMRKSNPEHTNNITMSSLIRFAVMHFYMAYLLGKIKDLELLEREFLNSLDKNK